MENASKLHRNSAISDTEKIQSALIESLHVHRHVQAEGRIVADVFCKFTEKVFKKNILLCPTYVNFLTYSK
jgi:hypothetical protein